MSFNVLPILVSDKLVEFPLDKAGNKKTKPHSKELT
jgi:hypothetical protein